jgi:tRNA uridine 5-carbamoylmethylation protein Kti12
VLLLQLVIAHTDIRYNLLRTRTLADLSRLRRQFIVYTKMHPIEGHQQIVTVFVNFLNCNQ